MRLLLFCLLSFLLFTCGRKEVRSPVEHSFYYWKTTFKSDETTKEAIDRYGIDHFYIHYFDVVWSNFYNMPVPAAEIADFSKALPFISQKFTPVIFITNDCLLQMDGYWTDSLALKIKNKILFITHQLQKAAGKDLSFDEIQIDGDWTEASQYSYFRFLEAFKKQFPRKQLSATIRLYPYKYSDLTGVPPVDKGLLMCYNMGEVKNTVTVNSIFSDSLLKLYLNAPKYPLPLDIALPVFGWYAWFRDGKLKGLITPDKDNLTTDEKGYFIKEGNHLVVQKDTVLNNNFITAGDILRREYPDTAQLASAAGLLRSKLPGVKRISFYYWNEQLIQSYASTIQTIYHRF